MNKPLIIAAALALAALTGCSGADEDRRAAQQTGTDQQRKYEASVPFPAADLKYPLERKNVAEYLKRNNDPARISYVYLLSMDAKVIAYYTIKGKVSSTGSQLLPVDDITDPCSGSYCPQIVDSAGDDGTYGDTDPGVFFFTTDGTLVTWTGDYIQSDRPLDVKTPVSLVAKVN